MNYGPRNYEIDLIIRVVDLTLGIIPFFIKGIFRSFEPWFI